MRNGLKAFFTHFFVLVFFIIAALAYFYPVLQGKVIQQSDIVQFTGMAKEQIDFRKATGEEPYWTNSAFGGMPTYQLGAYYPHDYVKKLDRVIRFLPRPADYLFLYFIGFYILLCCLKVDYKLAVLGALTFGFSTYLIIILGVGHNAKAHAIGYFPMLLGGIVLVFRKKYLWGFILTAVAMALEVGANHYQMTFYFMLLVLILGAVYLVDAIKKQTLKHFGIAVGILVGAVILGVAANATSLMATKEYADWSTRGASELTITPNGTPKENKSGLDREYITQYSYGISESLNLFVPRLFGGSGNENLGADSKTYAFLTENGIPRTKALEFASGLPLYWGEQPIVAAPAYIGAIVIFLFVLGLFLVQGKSKWWLVGGTVMSLVLSWGKNFGALTDFMIDYFPLYNKFRAVSSIQVILELCVPIMAMLTLVALFNTAIATSKKIKDLKIALIITLGVGGLLLLVKGMFNFEGPSDEMYRQYYGDDIVSLIKADRKAVYSQDIFRSITYVALAALVIWFFIKDKIKQHWAILAIGVLIVFDLVGVAKRYVDKDDFVAQRRMTAPFQETALEKELSKDTTVFRVFDPSEGLNGARTSYFNQSIGGYHAAKPAGIQDLFDYQIAKNNIGILNMLNVKYVIQEEEGQKYPALNPDANGNAWFVKELVPVKSADEEISTLGGLDLKEKAVVNTQKFEQLTTFTYKKDSTASIELVEYKPNYLKYIANNEHEGIAVFSEMYYANGWNAYIDGELKDHFEVNYVLRALAIPAGKHLVEFKFEPEVVKTGGKITMAVSILIGLIILMGLGYSYKKRQNKTVS
ncbi:YfhO family protein [Arenibacter sp. 6A1]|uniref:YfhO family protein n=1 Tax=Arenibacter sp. 6A1 TaxID=2720391 RepID=UPI0014484DD7|nr:YfhO family protein [Arenibacter sp. 6A1]NKI25079.1 YfhO family protein [Arenibacter sp. 6A1]